MNHPLAENNLLDLSATLQPLFAAQRMAFADDRYPSVAARQERIDRLIELLLSEADDLIEAMRIDFGHRSPVHSFMTDGPGTLMMMKDAHKNLSKWMRPEHRSAGVLAWFGARARIEWQPLGVVGVISPWNFPVSSALLPACEALAAGNRVMLKLSELTPVTSERLRAAIARHFDPAELVAVTGDAAVGAAFSSLPFNHLLFTGATSVGPHILRAAADNLVPVTLELGGKSPAIIAADADLAMAAKRIAVGKMINAGQVCLAPDYAMVISGKEDTFVELYRTAMTQLLPTLRDNVNYTSIINERHFARLQFYLDDARERGARVIAINPANESLVGTRKMAPHLILDATPQMKIMQDEIFGPLLPVLSYSNMRDVVRHINSGRRPLGAYYFGSDNADLRLFLQQTHSGGVTLNDVMGHAGNQDLPFGGVGASGMGSCHGIHGFRTFSHGRAIQKSPLFSLNFVFRPAFSDRVYRLMRWSQSKELTAVRKRLSRTTRGGSGGSA